MTTTHLGQDRPALVAMLQVAASSGKSPQAVVADVFSTFLAEQAGQIFDQKKFINAAQQVFGTGFTELVSQAIVPMLAANNHLTKIATKENSAIYRVSAEICSDHENDEILLETTFSDITNAFWEFMDDRADPLGVSTQNRVEWNTDLLDWLTSEDKAYQNKANESAQRLISRNFTYKIGRNGEDGEDDDEVVTDFDKYRLFRYAQFINYCRRNDPITLEKIAKFAAAGFVFRAVRGLTAAPEWATGEVDLTLVFDGPVVLDLIGLSGTARKLALARIVEVSKEAGIKLVTLSHCIEEAVEIVQTVIDKDKSSRWGLVGDALRESSGNEHIARQFIRSPDRLVENLGVSVLNFDPSSYPNEHSHFSNDLIEEFTSLAHFGRDSTSVIRRQRDAFSFAYVVRKRGTTYKSDILKSRYMLATRNATFVSFGARFVRDHIPRVPKFSAQYVIETSTLAALLWIRLSSEAATKLPSLQLFATCQRLLTSNKGIIEKARVRAAESLSMEDAEQFELALRDPLAVEELVVLNAKMPISASEPEQLLEAMRKSTAEAERVKFRRERKKDAERHLAQRQALEDENREIDRAYVNAKEMLSERNWEAHQIRSHFEEKLNRQTPFAAKMFDLCNLVLFVTTIAITAVGYIIDKENINTVFIVPILAVIALSAALRAPLVGPSLRSRAIEFLAKKLMSNTIQQVPLESLKSEFRLQFLDE
ncbi:hypothetical protein [Maricaulis maris]|uniref:Uncharacterized protein n=1 Tax=Maricaulis maris (strain MCS10) TaxID=394221 RepID=Q0ASG0_MARMM|nr:hypothetical protein [Maricaulis maris]ABI64777.1 hypothetical protein Mmar10_0484 [Maricaulis maris MCS10]